MNFYCKGCTARMPLDEIKRAMKNKEPFYECKFCKTPNELDSTSVSHTTNGYNYLAVGDFYNAISEFENAIEDSKKYGFMEPAQANLGHALAEYQVQTVFSEQDPDAFPEITCHICNERRLSDSVQYRRALSSFQRSNDLAEYSKAKKYSEKIDAIKDYYDEMSSLDGYDVFIAYEDCSEDSVEGYMAATRVRNTMSDDVSVFLPEMENYSSSEEYEAAILYAIYHSKCMLVITDNNIDSRLRGIYSRFFFKNRAENKEYGLAFVRYCDHISIPLPGGRNATNIFDEDIGGYVEYVDEVLGKIRNKNGTSEKACPLNDAISNGTNQLPDEGETHTIINGGRQIWMGSYPQKRCDTVAVKQHFERLGKPSRANDNGWTRLFDNSWYRDDVVNGKKYRAVYFVKYRSLYDVRQSDIPSNNQRSWQYMPGKIYCFSFDPILWNVTNMSMYSAVLVSSVGLDSVAFNSASLDNYWIHSTLRRWLNESFLETAFSESEREILFEASSSSGETERVFLVDEAYDEKAYNSSSCALLGSDYVRCIGGMPGGRKTIDSYWVISSDNKTLEEEDRAKVVLPENSQANKVSTRPVDRTDVSIVPKIKIKLNELIEG